MQAFRILGLILVGVAACKSSQTTLPTQDFVLKVPEGFPAVSWPADNAFSPERYALGKKLFFEPLFSLDGSKSCASCHAPHLAFADTQATSPGVFNRPGTRNAPSLLNVAYHPYFLRDGTVPTLEMQVLVPIQEFNEFNHNIVDIADTLSTIPAYVAMSQSAYGRNPDPFVITRALGVYERTLLSGNSAYDQSLMGNALEPAAERGKKLFFSERLACSSCHGGFNFTEYGLENNGLHAQYADVGRFRFTHDSADIGRFKVPSLRNVALTPPYMHDGSLATLEEVVEHYNRGGARHPNQSALVRPLGLSAAEMSDLVAFLEALTGQNLNQ